MKLKTLILPIFFLSGATGLIYEVIWARQLSLLFGVTAFAISSVLTVFMGGLGLGSFLGGLVVDRQKSPLKIYAAIELGIGLYALILPFGVELINSAYSMVFPLVGENFFAISLVRFVFSFLLLIIPSTLMGATFPIISRFFIRETNTIGKDAGALYSLNTLGGVCGCLISGFYLLENLGVSGSLYLTAGINLFLAMASLVISRWESGAQKMREPESNLKTRPRQKEPDFNTGVRQVLVLFGLSGFIALALEVFWTRIFIFLIDNTVYAFTTILFTFLMGIAGGAMFFSRVELKKTNLKATFGKMQAGIGVSGLLTLFFFMGHDTVASFWNAVCFKLFDEVTGGFWIGKMFASFLFIFSILFVPTFLMGGTFPVVFRICAPEFSTAGKNLGLIYSVNTIGAILGSFCAGFILLPILGTQNGIILAAFLAMLSGAYLMMDEKKSFKSLFFGPFLILTISFFILAGLLYLAGDVTKRISLGKLDPGNEVSYYKEGITGTVLVSSQESDRTAFRKPIKRIWINGDPIAGSFQEALQLEWLQAHIPLLLHPDPKEAVVICFGTGSTAGAISRYPVKEIIAVDTAREVFEAAPHFKEGNNNIVEDPRFRPIIEDGRQFLATTDRKFDFITSEPPPPSNAGIVSLYTREYYEICKSALKQGGIISQWIPLHHLPVEDFRSLVAGFVSVFPHSTLWYTKWDAIMMGSDAKLSIDLKQLRKRMEDPAILKDLREIGFGNPLRLLSAFTLGEDGLREFTQGAAVITDDRPIVEFSAPKIHHIGTKIKGKNLEGLLKYREPVGSLISFSTGEDKKGFEENASLYYRAHGKFLEGRLHENNGSLGKAVESYREALKLTPDFTNARLAFIKIHMDLAYFFLRQGKASAGLRAVEDCIEKDTDQAFGPQLLNLRGLFHLSLEQFQPAARDFQRALELDKDFPGPYMNLGSLYGQYLGRPKEAVNFFKQSLKLKITVEERKMIEGEISKLGKGF